MRAVLLRDELAESLASNASLAEPSLPPFRTIDVANVGQGGDSVEVNFRDSDESGEDAGAGRATFLLIHGLGGSVASWESMIAQLSEAGRVIALDLAGFGRTPGDGATGSVQSNARLVTKFIEALKLKNVVLVGNSMGGLISVLVASRRPELVAGLVLVDPVLPVSFRMPPKWRVGVLFSLYLASPVMRQILPRYVARRGIEEVGADGVLTVVSEPERVPAWVARRVIDDTKVLAEQPSAVAAMVRAGQSITMTSTSRGYRRALTALDANETPVLLIHGERDLLVPVKSARATAKAHPRWSYVEVPDVGHVPMYEAADWLAKQIAAFVSAAADVSR